MLLERPGVLPELPPALAAYYRLDDPDAGRYLSVSVAAERMRITEEEVRSMIARGLLRTRGQLVEPAIVSIMRVGRP